jgi:cobalt-zinc-cadmium efflux system membrane fusion protein
MNTLQHALRGWPYILGSLILGGLLGTITWRNLADRVASERARTANTHSESSTTHNSHTGTSSNKPATLAGTSKSEAPPNDILLPQSQWQAAGIQIAKPLTSEFVTPVSLTGKVTLNEDRIAHIYPMVEGTVDEVSVTLGQNVNNNDLLVVIHSREIGQAKLNLYQARLQKEIAVVKRDLQSKIAVNTRSLIQALRQLQPIQEIEKGFRSLTMGDYRERLLASYAGYLKSQADVTRLENVQDSGAVSGKLLLTAQANRNADLATFQARIEQIEYEMETEILLANQNVKEAETRVAVDSTSLRILGVDAKDIDSIDPASQGEAISHYPIRAPFNGTVITKDCALREQVRPSDSVLTIADLSSVWITADVFEEHVPLLNALDKKTVSLVNEAWPDKTFQAQVFFTGEIMDEKTRTISLRAIADNTDRLLKPGMFVNVLIPGVSQGSALTIPKDAVQEHEGKKFVFVHLGSDRFARRDVQTGPSNEQGVMIRQGIQADEPIVVQGGFILKSRMLAELLGEE